ncbi:putative protein ABIL5 isoform C [Glycine soja]|uniref:Protein ABIL5 n=1 Tax=Glycine soja TaxID=3848 RepID=A0A445J9P4_GLYSO|nr:putative protein ABIL5 isoform C [Glycine soja]
MLRWLQELRELRSELHKAAEYCETKFSQSEDKSDVVDNTKEYICRTMVTVVDHLGNVSANLDGLISHTNAFSEAELRIQCLQQRLLSCEQYARKLALAKLQWNENSLRFHPRYLSTPPLETSSSKKVIRDSESQVPLKLEDKDAPETYEDLPLFMYTHKPPVQNLKPTTATLNGHINLAMGRYHINVFVCVVLKQKLSYSSEKLIFFWVASLTIFSFPLILPC